MMNTKKLILPSVIGCLAAGMTVAPAYAQDEEAGMLEEVVVTGIRRSLINAMAVKENSSSIVEAVSPEDIGKLPDTSIAESLARLPGLAGERVNGRTSGISVRGFNEQYVATTMNGRELLGIGDNRGVEYDLYPSEIIGGATVFKTPDASLVTQGLGGVVDLQTLRPLEQDRIISINGNFEMNGMESANPDFDDTGHRLAFTYSDTFADDTMGFALNLATMESPSQEENVRVWGYGEAEADSPGNQIFNGHDSYVRSAVMERDTVSGVFQWEPNEDLTVTVDALYIDFLESKVFRGFEEAGPQSGSNYSAGDVEDGLVMNGNFDGFHSVIRNDGEDKDGDLSTFGFNVKHRINDTWSAELDIASSESSKDLLNLESYSGTGRASTTQQGDPVARSWEMVQPEGVFFGEHPSISTPDYTDPSVIRLAGPQAWGGAIAQRVGEKSNAQDGFINNARFEEELDTLRLSTTAEINGDFFQSVELGLNYSDRTKSKVNYGAFLTAPGFDPDLPAEDQTALSFDSSELQPYYVGTTDLSFLGLGGMVAYDGVGMYNDGLYDELDATVFETGRLGDTYTVNEEVTTAYVMTNFETGILTGNVGLQIVDSEQSSTGFDTFSDEDDEGLVSVNATEVTGGDDYLKLLPSLNLNFQMTENQVVRFATAKTMSRARMDDMRPNNTIGFSFDETARLSDDPDQSAWSGSSGNPDLRPMEAIQADISYEYYFADDGYLAATVFHKDLLNWHFTDEVITDFSEYIIEGYHDRDIDELVSREGITSSLGEAGGGKVDGLELQGSLPFYTFSDTLDGFGVIASATFLDGELENEGETSPIPGLSEEIYQLTVYYEKNGFEFRISGRKRDNFQSEGRGISLSLVPQERQGEELWDAQIGYDFGAGGFESLDGLTVTLQGQNLTDEDTATFQDGDTRQVLSHQTFGANYLLGVNYQF